MPATVISAIDDPDLVEKRRRQFVAAAADLFARNTYHQTTIKEIAQRAGISTGLIYSYVKSKEDVLFLVLKDVLDSYLREIPRALENVVGPIERFCAAVRAYCEVVGANPDATLLAYRETKSLTRAQKSDVKKWELKTNELISRCIQDCVAAGYFRSINVELVTYRIVMLAHGWALKSWRLKQIVTLEQYTDEGLDLFLNALMTKSGWKAYHRSVANVAAGGRRK
jgi:AcrR family transcriptional regulator